MKPTLITNVTNDMRVAQEEIFGPVACVIKFKTEDEVIEMANDSKYGLGGAVWTRDINRAIRVSRAIETGRMWVNTYNAIPAGAPFGGYKQSGIGRETHKVILEHYTQMKNIMINLSEAPSGFYPEMACGVGISTRRPLFKSSATKSLMTQAMPSPVLANSIRRSIVVISIRLEA